jgi:hypothetical protein
MADTLPESTASMISKIRALVEDFAQNDFEVFVYSNSNSFTLKEPHISCVNQISVNGTALESGQGATLNLVTNDLTITGVTFTSGDIIKVDYSFHKYSVYELKQYIKGALTWLSIFDYSTETYKIREDGLIVPSLALKDENLVCIVASILILPNYMHYRMPNLAINYPEKMCREDKIRDIVQRYKMGVGIVDIIQWNRSPGL